MVMDELNALMHVNKVDELMVIWDKLIVMALSHLIDTIKDHWTNN